MAAQRDKMYNMIQFVKEFNLICRQLCVIIFLSQSVRGQEYGVHNARMGRHVDFAIYLI